jgi:hypothetical protein
MRYDEELRWKKAGMVVLPLASLQVRLHRLSLVRS